jgi:hypothetical protein
MISYTISYRATFLKIFESYMLFKTKNGIYLVYVMNYMKCVHSLLLINDKKRNNEATTLTQHRTKLELACADDY